MPTHETPSEPRVEPGTPTSLDPARLPALDAFETPPRTIGAHSIVQFHLLAGFVGLFAFASLGVMLEYFHAWKSPIYLHPAEETRRLLFRLAHAHGALLSMLQLGVAFTFDWLSRAHGARLRFASSSFAAALVLLPLGFFVGGLDAEEGDPGVGIVLVPIGALLLLGALARTIVEIARARAVER